MSSLKRKEVSTGGVPFKAAKTNGGADGGRPSKRAKADKSGDFKKKNEKTDKSDKKNADSESTSVPATAGAATLVSRLKEDEPLFPRGGGSVLTPLEYKQIQVQAKSDALFDQQTNGAADKADGSAKKKQKGKRKLDAAAAGAKPADDGPKIESLNYKVCQFVDYRRSREPRQGERSLLTHNFL